MSGRRRPGRPSIQKALHACRAPLAERGILFPPTPPNPHDGRDFAQHYLVRALLAGDVEGFDAAIAGYAELPETVVSSEMFPILRAEGYALLQDRLAGRYDIRPVYYARHPVDRANSQAQQAIRSGNKSLAEMAGARGHASLRRQVEALAGVFGRDAVTVRGFGARLFQGGSLMADFAVAIGHPELAGLFPAVRENVSMTLETAQAIDRHRAETGDRATISGNDPRFRRGSTRFTLPPETCAAIMEKAAADLDWLAEEWGIDLCRPTEA